MKQCVRSVTHRLSFRRNLLLALLLCHAGCDRGSQPASINKPAPEFVVSDGVRTVDLNTFRGKIVVLNFWATYCVPCLEELPSLLQLQQKMPNLAIVAISIDQDDAVYRRFLIKNHVDILTVRDADMKVNPMYGTSLIPETYIIDRQGIIRRKFIDAQNWTSPEISDYLNKL